MSAPFQSATAGTPFPNLNLSRQMPRIIEIGPEAMPPRWGEFCFDKRIKLHIILFYEDPSETGKIWPVSEMLYQGVRRGDHRGADTAIDSTSGGFGLAELHVLKEYKKRGEDFPIKNAVCVVNRSLAKGKRNQFEEEGANLIDADSASEAMEIAEAMARKHGWWFTNQYWNDDNPSGWGRPAHDVSFRLPNVGIVAWGLGSGGGVTGAMPVFAARYRDRATRLRRVGCVVEDGNNVGGVRTAPNLEKASPRWKPYVDSLRYITEEKSRQFCAALWLAPDHGCIGGESMGFAAEGAMLEARELILLERDGPYRGPDGELEIVIPAVDKRSPYRDNFEKAGIYLPESEWQR